MQTLLNIGTVRTKAIVISELSLFGKLKIITMLELGREAMADDNMMMIGYQPGPRNMAGPAAYSLTQ